MKSSLIVLAVLLLGIPTCSVGAPTSHLSAQEKHYIDNIEHELHSEIDNHVASEEFMLAATAGNIPLMNKLFAEGANPNFETPDGLPVLSAVLDSHLHNKLAVIQELIKAGVDVNARISAIPISDLYLQRPDCDPRVLKALLDDDLITNPKHSYGEQLLTTEASSGNAECVKLLIQYGAHVNYANSYGVSALEVAILGEHSDVVSLLLAAGAYVNMPAYSGATPLIIAAQAKNNVIARMLLGHGANPCWRDEFGRTAKDYALKNGDAALAKLLVCKLPYRPAG